MVIFRLLGNPSDFQDKDVIIGMICLFVQTMLCIWHIKKISKSYTFPFILEPLTFCPCLATFYMFVNIFFYLYVMMVLMK